MTAMQANFDRDDRRVANIFMSWEYVAECVKAHHKSGDLPPIFKESHPVNFISTTEGLSITWRHPEYPPVAEGAEIPSVDAVQREHREAWRRNAEQQQRTIETQASRNDVQWFSSPMHSDPLRPNTSKRLYLHESEAVAGGAFVRLPWHWPEWLKARWIFQSAGGAWWKTDAIAEPQLSPAGWNTIDACQVSISQLGNFTPPPCRDWRESLWKNPNSP